MKIVLAFDSFKGTMSALEACEIVRDAIAQTLPSARIVLRPMADGGEGTAAVLLSALKGAWIPARVMGPLPHMELDAGFGWIEKGQQAIIEMASASGITHLEPGQLNPLKTTTYGTGALLKAAMAKGAQSIQLAVGGSATIDGGVGAAMALGWRFLDGRGKSIGFGGGELEKIARIIAPPSAPIPPIEVLCDVTNPLCGERGAATEFGPQKGATPEMVKRLDAGLQHLANTVHEQLGKDILAMAGGGAAGGLAAGAAAFFNAHLVSGINAVMEATGFLTDIKGADWVVTGEGRFDSQSMQGKVVSGVVGAAQKAGVRVAILAGLVRVAENDYRRHGIEVALATARENRAPEDNLKNAHKLLRERALELASCFISHKTWP